jgi:hypothetical protein
MPKAEPRRPLRLSELVPYEQDIHEATARTLDLFLAPPAEWCHYPAGSIKLTPAQVAKLARMGLKRGYPDFLIFWQRVWGIELKRPGAGLSKTRIVRTRRGSPRVLRGQEEVFPLLMASGAFGGIAVCRSVEEVLAQIEAWGIPLRGRVVV